MRARFVQTAEGVSQKRNESDGPLVGLRCRTESYQRDCVLSTEYIVQSLDLTVNRPAIA
jgi:hypothetical protein